MLEVTNYSLLGATLMPRPGGDKVTATNTACLLGVSPHLPLREALCIEMCLLLAGPSTLQAVIGMPHSLEPGGANSR